eukprot:TRINITY_DN12242_c0_g1_i5.p1 TRINITY_DN12242_c0_g1~~TRINITY_DN12242_c0_g1_i5.p1  ORF type:complete len:239 (+),score=19.15 TRINITY_DN12242_c0_g1_i5:320-1036(+)
MKVRRAISLGLSMGELAINTAIHMSYAIYVCCSAIALDFTEMVQQHRLSKARLWDYLVRFLVDREPSVVRSDRAGDISNGPFFEGFHIAPIILVHGIFGFGKGKLGGMSYFAGAESKDDHVFVPDLGSLSSVYDRARELFYYLKGGRVDYGEEHSAKFGHSRFGKTYEEGQYPEWDEDHPVHFVGHSAGAQVVRILQQMLADKEFEGYEKTSERWVLSITAVSGALNGTTRVCLDGIK